MIARWIGIAWFAACAIWSSVWCLSAAPRLGATFDEPTYVAAGLDRWRDGSIGGLMRLGTMPLPVDAVTLPLWLSERWRGERWQIATDGRGRVIESTDLDRVLPIARAMTLVFWLVLLAAGWRLGNHLAGPWGARFAVAFLSVEPTLLAHATLATTDVALTAFLLAFAASLIGLRRDPALGDSGRRLLIPGIWFGLALLSKVSALVFAPAIAICALAPSIRSAAWGSALRTIFRMTVVALAIAFLYCGSDWKREDSFVAWAHGLPDGLPATVARVTADRLPIFSNAGEGIVQQIKHNVRGHGTFLLGRDYARAVWFYFPVVFLIKTSAAILIAIAAATLVRRGVLAGNWLVAAAALVLVASPAFRVQTGVRMILPVLALTIVGVAAALVRAGRPLRVAAIALIAWSAIVSWRAWPDALTFANEAWGGPHEAYRFVSDSNCDWGQGLPELRRWADARGVDSMDVWYWGTDPEIRSPRWRALDVRTIAADEAAIVRYLQGRYLAVGATMLYGSVLTPATTRDEAERAAMHTAEALRGLLRGRPWSARTGTFFIYDFTPTATIR